MYSVSPVPTYLDKGTTYYVNRFKSFGYIFFWHVGDLTFCEPCKNWVKQICYQGTM